MPQSRVRFYVSRLWLLLVVAAIGVLADQVSKRLIENALLPGQSADILPFLSPYLVFTHVQNYGASFSMFQNAGVFFAIIAVVVSAVIIYYAPRLPEHDWLSRVALGLQLTGAIGNLIDRLRQGFVTDFIHFQIPSIGFSFAVFNVADSCLFVGVCILIIGNLLSLRAAEEEAKTQSQEARRGVE